MKLIRWEIGRLHKRWCDGFRDVVIDEVWRWGCVGWEIWYFGSFGVLGGRNGSVDST